MKVINQHLLDRLGMSLDHIGIAVRDLAEASIAYDALGLARLGKDEMIVSQQVIVRAYQTGETLLELLAPSSEQSPIARFLEKRGAGLHHIALRSSNLDEQVAALRSQDVPFLSEQPYAGRADSRVIFIHPRWAQGVLIELVGHG